MNTTSMRGVSPILAPEDLDVSCANLINGAFGAAGQVGGEDAGHGVLGLADNLPGIEGTIAPFPDQTEGNFDRIISDNLKGVFLCLRAEIQQMAKTGGGAIVNLASVAGLVGFARLGPYVASKHGVNGLTKNAALDYGKAGIRVNSVCPGAIDTRMLDSLAEQSSDGKMTSHEMHRSDASDRAYRHAGGSC